jgi:hypothetical protein
MATLFSFGKFLIDICKQISFFGIIWFFSTNLTNFAKKFEPIHQHWLTSIWMSNSPNYNKGKILKWFLDLVCAKSFKMIIVFGNLVFSFAIQYSTKKRDLTQCFFWAKNFQLENLFFNLMRILCFLIF